MHRVDVVSCGGSKLAAGLKLYSSDSDLKGDNKERLIGGAPAMRYRTMSKCHTCFVAQERPLRAIAF